MIRSRRAVAVIVLSFASLTARAGCNEDLAPKNVLGRLATSMVSFVVPKRWHPSEAFSAAARSANLEALSTLNRRATIDIEVRLPNQRMISDQMVFGARGLPDADARARPYRVTEWTEAEARFLQTLHGTELARLASHGLRVHRARERKLRRGWVRLTGVLEDVSAYFESSPSVQIGTPRPTLQKAERDLVRDTRFIHSGRFPIFYRVKTNREMTIDDVLRALRETGFVVDVSWGLGLTDPANHVYVGLGHGSLRNFLEVNNTKEFEVFSQMRP